MAMVKINIKTPCQESEDQELEAHLNWSVKDFKIEIEKRWPNHPRPADQRLVYAGKLLQDESILSDILRQDEELNCHTMHLICRQNSFSPSNTGSATPGSELRQRKNAPNAQSASATELYQNLVSSRAPGNSDSNMSSTTTANANSSTDTISMPFGGPNPNPWQRYLNSTVQEARQSPNGFPDQNPFSRENFDQDLMMQQMYAHYMTQYMHYMQSGGMWPAYNADNSPEGLRAHAAQFQRFQNPGGGGLNPVAAGAAVAAVVGGHTPGAPVGGQNAANQANMPNVIDPNGAQPQANIQAAQAANAVPNMNGPGANPGNVVMNAGAGGMGAMEEDDEDGIGVGGQRDILDWFYVASRVLVLFSIVYFYSSLARFALVAGLGLAVYLYRIGFFGQRMADHNLNANLNNNNNNNNVNQNHNIPRNNPDENLPHHEQPGEPNIIGEEVQGVAGNNEHEDVDGVRNINENTNSLAPVRIEPSFYQVATTFLTTFFTSLMPNEPQVI